MGDRFLHRSYLRLRSRISFGGVELEERKVPLPLSTQKIVMCLFTTLRSRKRISWVPTLHCLHLNFISFFLRLNKYQIPSLSVELKPGKYKVTIMKVASRQQVGRRKETTGTVQSRGPLSPEYAKDRLYFLTSINFLEQKDLRKYKTVSQGELV